MKTTHILITVTEFEENIRPIKPGDVVYLHPNKKPTQKGWTVIVVMSDSLCLEEWGYKHYPKKSSLYIPVSIEYSEYKPLAQ